MNNEIPYRPFGDGNHYKQILNTWMLTASDDPTLYNRNCQHRTPVAFLKRKDYPESWTRSCNRKPMHSA
jgi:hypothetical protein